MLTTKLYRPMPRPNLVPRPRLIETLDAGLAQGRRLTLVSAPAGFGKTTLIAFWVQKAGRPTAWLALDEGDNDPIQFFQYLIAALGQAAPDIGSTVLPMLQSRQMTHPQALATALINDLMAADTPLILVLDDYQIITSAGVQQAVGFLLDNLPPPMHVAICTREDPPLPLARMRARGHITEIRERDLRFTAEEAAAFLRETMGLDLSAGAVEALEARTEGWITGLQLAALALQKDPEDADAFIAAFTGDDRYIMDYLIAEVLEREPQALRDFLRQTSILDRLSAPLCQALTGREDSQALLEQLEAANLFLIPLDHRREWYRYHRLFAEVLRLMLSPDERRELHHRAARWYEGQGHMIPAIQHALAYGRLSGDMDPAERLIARAAARTIGAGGVMTVQGWLDALPDERIRANPALAINRGWVLAIGGDMAGAEAYADVAERVLADGERRDEEITAHEGEVLLLRCFVALMGRRDCAQTIDLAAEALQLLPVEQPYWRLIALWAMAEAQERTGRIDDAIRAFREAQQLGQTLGDQAFAVTVDMALASALNGSGARREAVQACKEAIARYTDERGRIAPLAAPLLSLMGTLHYEAHELEQARACYDHAADLAGQLGLDAYLLVVHGFGALTLYAQGEVEAALEALRTASRLAGQTGWAETDWVLAREAYIRLRQGDQTAALRWAAGQALSPDDQIEYLRLDTHLTYARLLLAQGHDERTRRWLDRLGGFVRERGLLRWLISVDILQALAAVRSGDLAGARAYLTEAVELAAPQDYVRAFLDEDAQVLNLLPDVRAAAPAFVDVVLAHARGVAPSRPAVAQSLIEPLSERELEVLGLIAAGLSNTEIAERLVIAQGTVKRHINNMYGKLGVQSRTQAVARARELRLLDPDR
ncbi:MAG: LuxR C-terminal-related transcriptional regulator [Anaerolineae bacterium]